MTGRHIIRRNRHANDRRLHAVVARANVAWCGTAGRLRAALGRDLFRLGYHVPQSCRDRRDAGHVRVVARDLTE